MNDIITLVAKAINALIEIWGRHTGKPPDWRPTAQDLADFLAQVDAASPEAEKAAARARLGIPPPA